MVKSSEIDYKVENKFKITKCDYKIEKEFNVAEYDYNERRHGFEK